jgi:hypothetical protein
MAKIPTTRLNSAPKEYNETDFDQLIEDLQDMIKVLNSTYPKDIQDEQDRKQFFFMRGT